MLLYITVSFHFLLHDVGRRGRLWWHIHLLLCWSSPTSSPPLWRPWQPHRHCVGSQNATLSVRVYLPNNVTSLPHLPPHASSLCLRVVCVPHSPYRVIRKSALLVFILYACLYVHCTTALYFFILHTVSCLVCCFYTFNMLLCLSCLCWKVVLLLVSLWSDF